MKHKTAALIVSGLLALTACGRPGEPVVDPENKVPGTKRLALSFDDGPLGQGPVLTGDERGDMLLDAFDTADTGPVVFFVTTQGFEHEGGRQRIERYAEAGHLIANHSHTHQWGSRVDQSAYVADLDEAERRLEGFENRRAWYRFPYLDEGYDEPRRDFYRAALNDRGLMNGYVTMDTYDWYLDGKWRTAVADGQNVDMDALKSVYIDMLMASVEFYDDLAVNALGRRPAQVILLHENDVNAHFIDDFVARVRADGWEIISPDEAYADPIAEEVTQTLSAGQGRIAAMALDRGADNTKLTHLGIEEDLIDALVEERAVFTTAGE